MGSAKFIIYGTSGASAHEDGGYDATEGELLQLEAQDVGTDIWRMKYVVLGLAEGFPLVTHPLLSYTFAPADGVATPSPGSLVDLQLPTPANPGEALTVWIRAIANNNGCDAEGRSVEGWVQDRIVSVRSAAGLRVPLFAEQKQYHPYGSQQALLEIVNGVTTAAAADEVSFTSGTPTLVPGKVNLLSGTVSGATIPAVSTWRRGWIIAKKKNIVAAVPLSRSGSDTIDGASPSYSLTGTYGAVWLRAPRTGADISAFLL